MYPFGELPQNLAAFCGALRRAHGFTLGPGEIADAARALEVVDVTDERQVRDALRVVLSSSLETATAFDAAFDAFFFPGPAGAPQHGLPRPSRGDEAEGPRPDAARPATPRSPSGEALDDSVGGEASRPVAVPDAIDDESAPAAGLATARYSPVAAEGRTALTLPAVDPVWLAAARVFVRRLELGLSRRWRIGRRGRRLDFRRTWRASLQTGGEALSARWRVRTRRRPRLVLVIDGSRSMTDPAALDLAVALTGATRRAEAFVFSTALRCVTGGMREAAAGRRVAVDIAREAWGGGTAIGASLAAFVREHGQRHLGRDTVVVIVSDGLDVGAPGVLRDAMLALRRRSAGVIWINPLLDTSGYEPTAAGMAAARPLVTALAAARDPQQLRRLTAVLRPL